MCVRDGAYDSLTWCSCPATHSMLPMARVPKRLAAFLVIFQNPLAPLEFHILHKFYFLN